MSIRCRGGIDLLLQKARADPWTIHFAVDTAPNTLPSSFSALSAEPVHPTRLCPAGPSSAATLTCVFSAGRTSQPPPPPSKLDRGASGVHVPGPPWMLFMISSEASLVEPIAAYSSTARHSKPNNLSLSLHPGRHANHSHCIPQIAVPLSSILLHALAVCGFRLGLVVAGSSSSFTTHLGKAPSFVDIP